MEPIHLPGLYCPFPSAVNKHAEALHQHTIDWVRKCNLIPNEKAFQHFCQSRFSDLAARVYPDATYTELTLLSDWNLWLFSLDDQIDEGGIGKQPEQLSIFCRRLLDVLKGVNTACQTEPLSAALQDIRQRMIQQKAKTFLMSRFISSVNKCLAASVWEAHNRINGITPDVATYIKMRTDTSGIPTIFDLLLIALQIDLPPQVIAHEDVQRLSLIANNVVSWANDIFSFNKEMKCGDVHNLVLALHQEHQCTLQQALQYATELHNGQVRVFIELETQLPSFRKDVNYQLQRYLSSLHFWMRGSLDWHLTSGRYRFAQEVILQ